MLKHAVLGIALLCVSGVVVAATGTATGYGGGLTQQAAIEAAVSSAKDACVASDGTSGGMLSAITFETWSDTWTAQVQIICLR